MTALKPIKTQAYQIVFMQLMIIMGLAVGLFLLRGLQNGLGALLGGLAYWLPTFYFAWRVFARRILRGKQFIVAFFAGEIGKLISSAILFLLIVKYLPITTLSALIGYIGAIVAFWIASVVYLVRNPGATQ